MAAKRKAKAKAKPKPPQYTEAEAQTFAALRKDGLSEEHAHAFMARPKKSKKGGKPSEYTGPEAYMYISLLERGLSAQRAQQYLGRDPKTIQAWAKNNLPFSQALTRAKPKREAFHLGAIDKAATAGDWRASAWALAVMNPDRYSVKRRLEQSGEMKITRDLGELTDKDLGALIAALCDELGIEKKPGGTQ